MSTELLHPAATTPRAAGCSLTCRRLQPYVPQAACNPISISPGELDFFLARRRSFDAVATSEGCTVLLLTREALQRMRAQASPLAAALEHAVLKYLCFQATTYYLLYSLLTTRSPPLLTTY